MGSEFGQQLFSLRTSRQKTRAELAAALSLTSDELNALETGQQVPTIELLMQITQTLNLNYHERQLLAGALASSRS